MASSFLSLEKICAGYDGREVLRGVTLDVASNCYTAVIGPNGHGKTTLMRAICGLVATHQGTITFNGSDITTTDPASRRAMGIAMVPQGDLLFPQMTVQENLMLGGHVEKDADRLSTNIDKVYEIFPILKQRTKQLAYTLSGGERRMLSIGRALAANSQLLVVDEPSLGLSPKIVDEVYNALEGLSALGVTVLLVEENVSRASEFANQLYLIDQGDVTWSGTPEEASDASDILSTYLGA